MSDGHSLADRWWREPHTEHVQRPLDPVVCKVHGPYKPFSIIHMDCPQCLDGDGPYDPYHFPLGKD